MMRWDKTLRIDSEAKSGTSLGEWDLRRDAMRAWITKLHGPTMRVATGQQRESAQ